MSPLFSPFVFPEHRPAIPRPRAVLLHLPGPIRRGTDQQRHRTTVPLSDRGSEGQPRHAGRSRASLVRADLDCAGDLRPTRTQRIRLSERGDYRLLLRPREAIALGPAAIAADRLTSGPCSSSRRQTPAASCSALSCGASLTAVHGLACVRLSIGTRERIPVRHEYERLRR